MSKEDLVKRGDVLKEAVYLNVDTNEMVVFVQDIKKIPAVPQEMTAREFVRAGIRLCKAHYDDEENPDDFVPSCKGCPLEDYCEGAKDDVDEEIAVVEKWAREHPEERSEDNVEARI